MKIQTWFFCIALLLTACGKTGSDSPRPNKIDLKQKTIQGKKLQRIEWETIGYGSTYFIVEPTTDGNFRFYSSRPRGRERAGFEGYVSNRNDGALFESLNAIFQGQCTIFNSTRNPHEGNVVIGGSWIYLTFIDESGIPTRYYQPTFKLDSGAEFSLWDIRDKANSFDPEKSQY